MRSGVVLLLAALLAAPVPATAGAWTEPNGDWFVISSFDLTRAGKGFDDSGDADAPVKFDKTYMKNLIEYGWNDRLTLFAVTDYVIADARWADEAPIHARDASAEAGLRYRISDRFGVWSIQASYKTAGPFDLSNSIEPTPARIEEARLLYGAGFKLFGLDGFSDIEAAQRWITRPRPDETAIDLTAGLWFGPRTMVMLQNFNIISGGDARPPYGYFRTHKLELSLVRRLSERWALQLGGFISPAGQNSLVEQGVSLSLWTRF
ncbi:MAG TPA: hypothetical protein VG843_10320 [Rhizomicrobium sp.]|jgi:hypothetical protein|nr:hypothetical protein [Rhizomicrobium sp.]